MHGLTGGAGNGAVSLPRQLPTRLVLMSSEVTGLRVGPMCAETSGKQFDQWPAGLPLNVLLLGANAISGMVRSQLSRAGYNVRQERDGDTALAALGHEPFDLVIADWELPNGGAERLCRSIRTAPQHAELYILLLVPANGPVLMRALQTGADDYLTLPLREAELLARARVGCRSAILHANEVRLRTLIANVPGAIYRCANDPAWTMRLISDDIERISGYPSSDFVESTVRTFASIIHPDDRTYVERFIQQATEQGRIYSLEYRIVRADGSLAWVLDRGQQVPDGSGRIWLDGAIFDITDRKEAEEGLHKTLGRLAVADDRQRIARDLHDGVIQSLFGVSITLQALCATADNPAEVRVCLSSSVNLINSVIDDIRNYIHGLRPGLLADRELQEALDALAGDFQESSGIVVALNVDPTTAAALDPHAEDIVQMVREALSNVRRHAQAATCRVTLRQAAGGALLEIDDDGRGFDRGAIDAGGHGLPNMAHRAASLGGQLAVQTDSAGTIIRINLPLGIPLASAAPREIGGGLGAAADFELAEEA